MQTLKKFLKSKQAIRGYWAILNVVMGLIVSLLTLLASDSVTWAVAILPFATAISQWFTKEVVNK